MEAGKQVLKQEVVPRDRGSLPAPMEVSGMRECISDGLSKMAQSAQETFDPPEVISPYKPMKSAQAYEANKEQQPDQGLMKA